MREFIFEITDFFYIRFFPLYKVCYFFYKRIADRSKIRRLKKEVKPGMTVLDIGSNIGFYASLLAQLVGEEGRVYAFEPDERNFEHLEAVTKGYSNIVRERCAVAATSGRIMMYRSGKYNVDHRTYDSGEEREEVEVECRALDDYFPPTQRIDLVKIDIQGFEYHALQGMKKLIMASPDIVILSEFWPHGLLASGVQPSRYLEFVEELGFKVQMDSENHWMGAWNDKANDRSYYVDFFATKRPK